MPISPETLAIVRQGLWEVVNGGRGTARVAKLKGIEISGKTGTAQVVGFKERAETDEELAKIPVRQRDHAWFIAITQPAGTDAEGGTENQLVIAVLCEHGGHASGSAVIVVREIARRIAALEETEGVRTATADFTDIVESAEVSG